MKLNSHLLIFLGAIAPLFANSVWILWVFLRKSTYIQVPEESLDEIATNQETFSVLIEASLKRKRRIFLGICFLLLGQLGLVLFICYSHFSACLMDNSPSSGGTPISSSNASFAMGAEGFFPSYHPSSIKSYQNIFQSNIIHTNDLQPITTNISNATPAQWLEILTEANSLIYLSNFLVWAVLLATSLSISPGILKKIPDYISLVDETSVCRSTKYFDAIFRATQLFEIVLFKYWVYTTYLENPKSLLVPSQYTVIQPIVGLLLILLSKLGANEARFTKRLLMNDVSNKELKASTYSRWTFSYVDDLMAVGSWKPLDMEDLDALVPGDTCEEIVKEFEHIVNVRAPTAKGYTLAYQLFLLVKWDFFWQQVATFVSTSTILAGPLLLQLTLNYLENPSTISSPAIPYAYAVCLFVVAISRSIGDGQTYFLGRRCGLRIRAILISLIYKKSLKRLSAISLDNSGKLTNLMSVDASKILDVTCYLMYLWSNPVQAILCIGYLIYITGLPGLAGVAVMVIAVPIAAYLGSLLQGLRMKLMHSTDVRVNYVNELLQGIRIVKFFAWEERFEEKIGLLRDIELKYLLNYILASAGYRVMWTAVPVLVSFTTFATLTLASGTNLSISTAFTCLAIFQVLQRPLIIIPDIVVSVLEAYVSFKRIKDYLDIEVLEDYINIMDSPLPSTPKDTNLVQFRKDSVFSWFGKKDDPDSPATEFSLSQINLTFPKNGLSIIYGATGSGKTALMSAIIGELNCNHGGVLLFDKKSPKSQLPIAYTSQQIWLQNATIKDNILFGSPFNHQRYKNVIKYCALERDLAVLDAGELTEVGEKCVNLSGGQKARISLARALYSSAPVILMDDPLSAVDSPTARHLFEQAICGPLMVGRTRILVTHAVSLCIPKADLIIEMKRGRPFVKDSPKSIGDLAQKEDLLMESIHSKVQKQESTVNLDPATNASGNGQLIEIESRMKGSVKLAVYWMYCKAAGGLFFVFLLVLSFISAQMLLLGNDFWIKVWADAYTTTKEAMLLMIQFQAGPVSESAIGGFNPSSVDLFFYIGIYGLIGLSSIFVLIWRIAVVTWASLRASRKLHHQLTHQILRAKVSFFEKNPMGRVLNRFTRDIKDLDLEVAQFSGDFLQNLVKVTALLLVILIVTPISALAFIPVAALYSFIGNRYLQSAREMKRLESNTRSPIFSHFGETLNGASIVRAYSVEETFVEKLYEKVDINDRAFSLFWILNRWLGVRVDACGALVGLATTVSVVFLAQSTAGVDTGFAGLSIAYSLSFSESLLWLIRMHALMEMEMNAVERIGEYCELEEEAPAVISDHRPPADWPTAGEIKVKNLSLQYSLDAPLVLDNLSFNVKPGEKIGIVGRTGAGKSTLSLAFFRFMEFSAGSIFIDGVDISAIGLFDLRSKVTIIPQDPVLFSGSLRSNLDPFNEYEDEEIWSSLKSCHFLESCMINQPSQSDLPSAINATSLTTLRSDDAHNITLETAVSDGGTNFSQGQRQLLALARATLRNSKLIILDEASASLDEATDTKIQNTIRERFATSSLLCIAHRLTTILDFDRILVLDKGKKVQFDTPYNLLQDKTSLFFSMCSESGHLSDLQETVKRIHLSKNKK